MGNAKNRRQLFDLSQAKAYMRTMLVASGCKKLIDAGQDHEPPGSLLHAQAHDRRREGKHLRRSGRVRHDHRRRRSAARRDPRRAASLRRESRRDGRRHHVHRQGRRNQLRPHGLRRLRDSFDLRARSDSVRPREVQSQVHPACRKGHGLAAVQRRPVLGKAQLHPHARQRSAAARRAADAVSPAQRTQAAALLRAR